MESTPENTTASIEQASLFEPLKRLSAQSLIYGVGHVATRIISFLLLPFYTHLITPAEYGEVTLLFIFVAVVHVFYTIENRLILAGAPGLNKDFFEFPGLLL